MTSRGPIFGRVAALRALREECAGIAAALADSVSRGVDHLRDYDRGQLAAARHIERRIRELTINDPDEPADA